MFVHPVCGHSGECNKNARNKRVVEVGGISRAIM